MKALAFQCLKPWPAGALLSAASLPEVAGNAAITCSPHDSACLADTIYNIFTLDSLYTEMSQKGLIQAKKFSWGKAAEKTMRIFAELVPSMKQAIL